MSSDLYRFKYDEFGNTRDIAVYGTGPSIMSCSYTNKSTAFSSKERDDFGLQGSLPPGFRDLEAQVENCHIKLGEKESEEEKYIFIRSLFDRNVTLAHALIQSDLEKFMGIIYTPTVGLAVQKYSAMFRQANGLHFSPDTIDQAEDILRRFAHRDIRVAVVTDNQGILGIGDQGAGGIAICLGKLMLYTQGAGIAPWHCLPISLDIGTDNEALLADKHYLGWRQKRLVGDEYTAFIDRFARAFRNVFPNALCQWEDFSKQNAFDIRDKYRHSMVSFNDDVQGTGAITFSAILSAMKVKRAKLTDQVFLIHGAGAGGVGIGEQIQVALMAEGLSEEEARDKVFTIDSRGVVTVDRKIEAYKKKFAKDGAKLSWLADPENHKLENVIKQAGVTVLIGTSGQGGCFTETVVKNMLGNTERPVIFPLSNPTHMAEAQPKDIYAWTNGQALVATGSPFAPVEHDGKTSRIGQCNNVFVFPGVGLGVLASGAREVLPEFFTAAAYAVSNSLSQEALDRGCLVPEVSEISKVSEKVALAVATCAIEHGVSRPCVYSDFSHNNDPARMKVLISKMRWSPEYLPMTAM
ncbi:NAD-dependent malic enzyme [Desulfotalea psychrophila]|uniref:Related to NAD-dependent malic enzyme n=1 Tax=Desulfotalea psychrophila (strain LSv54 / DSM 12343) TaxID=177439 RepID=Q6AL43_DESPS|nr:NAD-dependent malic enzyme [Desulfotalea psychrophila]CAG36932.1 related to NAD-dependent malic enzyme [Desulfotalea psychrophila LSv54]